MEYTHCSPSFVSTKASLHFILFQFWHENYLKRRLRIEANFPLAQYDIVFRSWRQAHCTCIRYDEASFAFRTKSEMVMKADPC